jgi:hypothetical protein
MDFLPVDDQLEIISRGTEEVIPLKDLRKKLERSIDENTPLIVKLGVILVGQIYILGMLLYYKNYETFKI